MVTGKQIAGIAAVSLLAFGGYLIYDSGDTFMGASGDSWCDTDFTKRVDVNLNNTAGSALTDYQVYVDLTASPINETSMRVYNSTSCTLRPHWCENETGGNCYGVWINYSEVAASSWVNNTAIYYDNVTANSVSNLDATFTKDYGESGLVGLWHMDDGSGTNVEDTSGNGNNGTFGGSPTWNGFDGGLWDSDSGANFSAGDSIDFDGTNDYIDLPSGVGLDEKGTLEMWVKLDTLSSKQYLWADVGDGSNEKRMFVAASGDLRFIAYDNSAYQYILSVAIPDTEWHHIVGTFQDNDARLYFDGVEVASDTAVNMDAYVHNYLTLATFNDGASEEPFRLNGVMDEVRIYNRIITPEEVKAHYERRKYAVSEPSSVLGSEEEQSQDPPLLSGQTPSTPHSSTYASSVTFNATSNQSSNNRWILDSVLQEWDNATAAPTYTNSTAPTGTYNLTLVAHAAGNDSLTDSMTWAWTVTLVAPPDIMNGVYGFLNSSIPGNATILDYKNDSIVTVEATIDWDAITAGTWNNFKAAVAYSYGINRRTALRMNCDGEYNTTAYDDTVKANITTYMPDLKADPYQIDLQYIVINLTNTSAPDADKAAFANEIAQNISEQTNNKFKTVVLESLSGLDSAWVSVSPIIYIELDSVGGWIDDETETLRGNTTLSRVYSGNESFLDSVHDHKSSILNKMRGDSNISNQYTETYSVKVDNDIVLYNNGSSSTNRTVASALSGYYWALENDTMQDISGGAATVGFWISGKSYDYIIKEPSLDRIVYVSDTSSKLWGGEAISDEERVYNDGIYDDAYTWAGTHTDMRAEFWDPTYTKENTHMIHYEWINASAIKDYSTYDYIVIADQNANEINNTIARLNDTYGYISVADYVNNDAWQTNKVAECDVWIDTYCTNIFIDGIDFSVASENASSRLKDIADHIRTDKGKKVIMNTYTYYQEYATYGDAVMKESAFSRWDGAVGNPNYSWEVMSIEKDRADFYTSHNIPVLAMSFGNLTNYDKMAFDYAAFAVLYGMSGNNSFRYGQPNFQTQKDIRVHPLGTMLEASYTETSATDWNRLYQNGRMHINPVDHTWSLDDNKIVNNISISIYLYSGAAGSGDRNVYVFANTNDTIHTIPYYPGVDPTSTWVYRATYLNATEYKDHGHYYVYAYTRPTAGGWNFIGKATADPAGDPKTWYDTTTQNLPTTTDGQTWNTVLPYNFMCKFGVNYTTSKYLDTLVSRITQTQTQVLGYDYTNSTATYDFTIPVWHGEAFVSTSSDATTHIKNGSGGWQELNVSLVSDAASSDITWNYTTVDGGQYGAVRELISSDYYKYRYLSPHMSLQQFRSGVLLTTPGISNIQNGSISSTSQYVNWTVNQIADNIVIYDKGSTPADSTACVGQWSATHACANASDGNWSSYAESAGALLAYAYFNHTVPVGTSQPESLWHVKDNAGHANVTIPAACWGATLYLRAMGSDTGNSMTWQCDNGPGWTTLRSTVANHAYEEEMSFKYKSTWDNATAAPNITLTGLTPSTGYNFYVRACNVTNEALCANSSVYTFTTAAVAVPAISSWSSTGGNTTNKDDAADIMYQIHQGDVIMFSAESSETANFSWQVNKEEESNATNVINDSFNFTVPNENDIWEVHLNVSNVCGEAHMEWAIANLSASAAPIVFEYFSDKKYDSRIDTDPWGRALPEWIKRTGTVDISNCTLASSVMHTMMDAPSTTVYGTWEFQFKFSEGGADYNLGIGVYPAMNDSWDGSDYAQRSYRVLKGADEHLWLDYLNNTSGRYPIAYKSPGMGGSGYYCIDDGCVGGKAGIGRGWHHMRIVHDTDGIWYMWLDNDYVPYSSHWVDREDVSTAIGLYLVQPDARRVWLDNIEVYDEAIFPEVTTTYNEASNCIIVNGWNNTLSELASEINNVSIISYNGTTKTATCNANITLARGANMMLTDETLLFNISDPYVEMKPGWNLIMNESTITTDGSNNVLHYRSAVEGHSDYVNGWRISGTHGKLIMLNSTIEHVNRMFLTDLRHFDIQDSSFLNVIGANAINSIPHHYRDYYLQKNATYTTQTSKWTTAYNEWQGQLYDSNISGSRLACSGTMYFVNTQHNTVFYDYYAQNRVHQFYLDVQVIDLNGDPVSDATVTVTNESDNENYPAENMKTGWEWAHPTSGQVNNWYRKWIDANNLTSTTTGENGHTPLPLDGDDTIIITDYVMWKNYTGSGDATRTNFTYNITVSKEGCTNSTIVNPDTSWYRTDPNSYQNTTIIVLPLNYDVYAYANEYALFNNWSAAPETFVQIDANMTNDTAYSYYNGSTFLDYWSGYYYNNDTIVAKNDSCFVYFTADTTIDCVPHSGGVTIKNGVWHYTFLPGSVAKTLSEINASMVADGGDVWSLYRWVHSTESYNATGTVQPNEGVVVYANNTFVWTI